MRDVLEDRTSLGWKPCVSGVPSAVATFFVLCGEIWRCPFLPTMPAHQCDMSKLMTMRKAYKEDFEKKHGIKLGFMSCFVKACSDSLREMPAVNGCKFYVSYFGLRRCPLAVQVPEVSDRKRHSRQIDVTLTTCRRRRASRSTLDVRTFDTPRNKEDKGREDCEGSLTHCPPRCVRLCVASCRHRRCREGNCVPQLRGHLGGRVVAEWTGRSRSPER